MKPEDDPKPKKAEKDEPPDGRGERPTDPNELTKWVVDQTTTHQDDPDPDDSNERP